MWKRSTNRTTHQPAISDQAKLIGQQIDAQHLREAVSSGSPSHLERIRKFRSRLDRANISNMYTLASLPTQGILFNYPSESSECGLWACESGTTTVNCYGESVQISTSCYDRCNRRNNQVNEPECWCTDCT